MSDLVICLRHGEKPVNAKPPPEKVPCHDKDGPGFDEHGHENAHSLTIRGWKRAGALAATYLCGQLGPPPVLTPIAFLVPRYLTAGRDETTGHRSHQTVSELARRMGLHPTPVHDGRDLRADDPLYIDLLHERVTQLDGVAVVCWQHGGLVQLAQRLAPRNDEYRWPKGQSGEGRFDVIWRFQRTAPGTIYAFKKIDQELLASQAVDDADVPGAPKRGGNQ